MASTGKSTSPITAQERAFFESLAEKTGSTYRDVVRFFIALGLQTYYAKGKP